MVKNRLKFTRRGFSLIELLIVISIILIILAIALPKLNKAQQYAREMAAATTIQRAIHPAEAQFMSQYGRYAVSLTELGPPSSGSPGPSAADLIPGDLSKGEKGGYKYTITGTPQGYQVNAEPTSQSIGSRTFYSDQSLVIHQHNGQEPATATDAELGSTAK
ncbi:prepilin-type N-terminal cleavage/methylation domain-containing protein [Nevskia soli]|jgi:prepilin-type N-terminal cleavage/methylation domain-containing protein|uniref:prepilin-type N-terminal cleavage/methylation domain-containing protein n=1 Tax=Nevskia soli TaxID=418856 RepID=UPI0015D7643C|nr:prepilin-type N-terminal cleavage/methylation domain-containing protein [Nevskia soli]